MVSTAAIFVEPRPLLTTTVLVPLSASVTLVSVKVLLSGPERLQTAAAKFVTESPLPCCHWRHNGLLPSATTGNIAVSPGWSVRLVGARTMMGGDEVTMREASALFVDPNSFRTCRE